MAKRALSKQELEDHLATQIQFMQRSAKSFDDGEHEEAVRLATSIRILLHDTSTSHSLLGQLGRKEARFFDTSFPLNRDSATSHGGLVWIALGKPATRFVAMLDDVPEVRQIEFDAWWNTPVFVDEQRRELSRKNLILTAANQDGGAHVDPHIDEVYSDLSRNNSLGWMASDGVFSRPITGAERVAIRQIAHEVLKTIVDGYALSPSHVAELFVGGSTLVKVDPPASIRFGRKVGRNESCPCGSRIKFKRCCGRL